MNLFLQAQGIKLIFQVRKLNKKQKGALIHNQCLQKIETYADRSVRLKAFPWKAT